VSANIKIGGICEQDLDLFLLEECVSGRPFLSWLLSQVPRWPEDCKELVAAERSATRGNGESDLELTLRDNVGRVGMVLIENKLAAGFQPQQLPRYRDRASMYVQQDRCAHASVILFAPRAYTRAREADVDAVVEYEAVEAWLRGRQPDERLPYKLQLLATALQKHGLGYNPATDLPVTTFWNLYWREATTLAPELRMSDPGTKPGAAGFVYFREAQLPESLTLCHKLPKGAVDLQFAGWADRIAALEGSLRPLLEPGMEVARATNSAAVRIQVPVLSTGRPMAEQVESVREGLDAAKQLHAWVKRHRARIVELLAATGADLE
jgi:hypothetical protein